MMGIKPSPYLTTQSIVWVKEFMRGDYCYCDFPFWWLNIHPSFPGDPKYSPILPWVSKIAK